MLVLGDLRNERSDVVGTRRRRRRRLRLFVASAGIYLSWILLGRRRPRDPRSRSRDEHDADVARLQETLRTTSGPFRLRKRRDGHQARAIPVADGRPELNLRSLNGILALSPESGTAVVEPQVTVRQLVRAAARAGLVPAVVPEFPEITIGGAIQGLAAESTCHRHGLFHESVEWMDVLLGDGELVRVSPTEHVDLWSALPGSYGSLGTLVAASLRLVPGTPWIRVEHRRTDLSSFLDPATRWPDDFVDAICDQGEEVVVTTGNWAAFPESGDTIVRSRWFDPYHCDRVMATAEHRGRELMDAEAYLFRYDRGAFWVGPDKLGRSLPSRLIFGGFANAANLYRLRRTRQRLSTGPSRRVVQDCIVPADRAEKLVRFVRTATDGPLWLLPITAAHANLFGLRPGRWVNVGVYGRMDRSPDRVVAFERDLEREVTRLGGVKTLHAELFSDREALARVYDLEAYEDLRRHYRAERAFPHIFDKLGIAG